jgi:hypothetical protein
MHERVRGPPLDVYVNLHGGKLSETAMRKISIRVIDAGDIHVHERSFLLPCSIDPEAGARRLVHRRLRRYRDDRQRGIQYRSVVVVIIRRY